MIDWSAVRDFLAFRSFVSPLALPVFYYLGAVAMPLLAWILAARLGRRYALVAQTAQTLRGLMATLTRPRDRWRVVALTAGLFLFLELLWRMMFEFLIAYLQIRDALLIISTCGATP